MAPFKAQNMGNNARVVPALDGGFGGFGEIGEIGSAPYLQALAARAVPFVDANPVLLKPEHDTASQVVLRGRARLELGCIGWRERNATFAQAASESFDDLTPWHEVIVVEEPVCRCWRSFRTRRTMGCLKRMAGSIRASRRVLALPTPCVGSWWWPILASATSMNTHCCRACRGTKWSGRDMPPTWPVPTW